MTYEQTPLSILICTALTVNAVPTDKQEVYVFNKVETNVTVFYTPNSHTFSNWRTHEKRSLEKEKDATRKAALDRARQRLSAHIDSLVDTETFVSLRMAHGYSQSSFAKNAQIAQPYLSRIENNRTNISRENILKIATFLNVEEDRVRASFNALWDHLDMRHQT